MYEWKYKRNIPTIIMRKKLFTSSSNLRLMNSSQLVKVFDVETLPFRYIFQILQNFL